MSKKNLTLMQEFNKAVFDSVVYKKDLKDIGGFKFYYSKEYGRRIDDFLSKNNVVSKETDKGSLMSASSSARLCTNYFYNDVKKEGFEFEKPLYNDVSSTPTKMDAVDNLTFYECKCQEIVNGEHELLRKSYYTKKSSKLFKEFSVSNLEIKKHFDKDGKQDFEYCDFDLKDIDIDYPGKYHDINFNVKKAGTGLSGLESAEYSVNGVKKTLSPESIDAIRYYYNKSRKKNATWDQKKLDNNVESFLYEESGDTIIRDMIAAINWDNAFNFLPGNNIKDDLIPDTILSFSVYDEVDNKEIPIDSKQIGFEHKLNIHHFHVGDESIKLDREQLSESNIPDLLKAYMVEERIGKLTPVFYSSRDKEFVLSSEILKNPDKFYLTSPKEFSDDYIEDRANQIFTKHEQEILNYEETADSMYELINDLTIKDVVSATYETSLWYGKQK